MGRIFNGTTLDSRDLQFVAAIYGVVIRYTKTRFAFNSGIEYKFFCTGAIISPSFVLT